MSATQLSQNTSQQEESEQSAYMACLPRLIEAQAETIIAVCGQDAVRNTNFAWGEAVNDNSVSVASKVYGHGVLHSNFDLTTGTIEHSWALLRHSVRRS